MIESGDTCAPSRLKHFVLAPTTATTTDGLLVLTADDVPPLIRALEHLDTAIGTSYDLRIEDQPLCPFILKGFLRGVYVLLLSKRVLPSIGRAPVGPSLPRPIATTRVAPGPLTDRRIEITDHTLGS